MMSKLLPHHVAINFLLLIRFCRSPSGIIPRDGRNISFREITTQIRTTYNFAPSFSLYVPRYIAKVLNRSYNNGRFDLSDIDVHNGIEHDASLVRKCQTSSFPTYIPTGGTPALAEANLIYLWNRARHIPTIPPRHARRRIGSCIDKVGHGPATGV